MEENRFFIFAWRFNAIILLVAGILAIGILIFAGYHIIQDITRERSTRNIVNVTEDQSTTKGRIAFSAALLPAPEILAHEIVENLGVALSEFQSIVDELENPGNPD